MNGRSAFGNKRGAKGTSPTDIGFSMTALRVQPPLGSESSDAIAKDADAVHLELDDAPRLQPASVAVLEDASRPDRPRAEHVSRQQSRVARRMRHDRLPRVVHVGQPAA